jgi:hypothetical protein
MLLAAAALAQSGQPGADLPIYSPRQHAQYDGHFVISSTKVYQAGRLNDAPGWDHIDNEGKSYHPVQGSVEIDVDEIRNTGSFLARLKIPEGDLVLQFDRFRPFNPCQDGGIAAFIFEHGDSGCGDTNWPKALLYLGGWGDGHATLNGQPLYDNYEMHFMLMQGMRDRKTLRANYPMVDKAGPAGEVNPATQMLDFFIRSPETDARNNPTRKVFQHFIAMEVTWK